MQPALAEEGAHFKPWGFRSRACYAAVMSGWITCRLTEKVRWAEGLATLVLSPAELAFVPGQFVNLALDIEGERVKRAYSLASAPGAPPEFYVSAVAGGVFSP